MASTLTGAGELTYASFPIEKVETDADGDLIVYGKASDGSIDSDQQIVDPSWMASAAQAWKESGANLRVQHNPQRDPAGIGLEVETDSSGATWVKGLVVEPVAKKLVAKGALRAYSVGIARPTIERDAMARGGRITSGELVEISLVDRPANKRCGIQLVKSADDGTPEYVGKVFGSDDAIAKALGTDVTKAVSGSGDLVNVDLPPGASISISPADFAKLHTLKQQLTVKTAAAADTEKRDVGTAERRSLASEGDALPDGSYPIKNTGDLHNAAHLARTGHGDVAAARRLIARRARELGVANPLDADDVNKSSSEGEAGLLNAAVQTVMLAEAALKEAGPEVTKDPDPEPEAKGKPVKKAKGKKKKLPPWLNKPADGDSKDPDGDGDSDDDGGDASKSCKQDHVHTEKCRTDPATAAGVTAAPMDPAPVGELLETPPPVSAKNDSGTAAPAGLEAGMMKSSPEVAAILRFKAAGIGTELGRVHDLTCPAYHPEDVAKCHPFADFRTAVDEGVFQRKAVEAACGPSLDRAKSLHLAWQAARVLREADPAVLNDYRLAAHKAFRDANPGPASAPTPGMMSPGKYNRPCITEGHATESPGYGPPNTSPQVATSAPNAHSFDRPPLSAGHQSPSPSFMKASFEYPAEQGRPVQLNYAVMEKERARHALMAMHEHLSRQFPEACPMSLDAPVVQPESRGVPAAVGKGAAFAAGGIVPGASGDEVPAMLDSGYVVPAPAAAAFKAPAEDEDLFADAEVWKGFKKQRKKLGKKVLSGSMTVDEARAKLGRQFAQKAADDTDAFSGTVTQLAEKGLTAAQVTEIVKGVHAEMAKAAVPVTGELVTLEAANSGTDPEVIKSAVAEATSDLKDLLVRQQETFTAKLAEQQRVIDAIADQPDPSTAAFSGLAFNPLRTKSRRPAGVADQAEIAERTQQMVMRTLRDKYNSSSDPHEREAYYTTLSKMRGYSEP